MSWFKISIIIPAILSAALAAPTPFESTALAGRAASTTQLQNIVLFGDSYTDTHIQYNIDSIPSRPIDTKTPIFPPYTYGYTADGRNTNGGGWMDYFQNSTGINDTNIANEACACGTTDDLLVPTPCTFLSGLRSVRQMEQTFSQVYGTSHSSTGQATATDFDPSTSLYVVWIGYNDVQQIAQNMTLFSTLDQIVQNHYATNLVPLAPLSKNFLFMNLSPLDLAPKYAADPSGRANVQKAVTQWNTAITNATNTFKAAYPDKWVGQYDMYTLFNRMISGDLQSKYDFEYFTRCDLDTRCNNNGSLINKFFYANDLHPASKTHSLISEYIRSYIVSEGFSFPIEGPHAQIY